MLEIVVKPGMRGVGYLQRTSAFLPTVYQEGGELVV